MPNKCETKLEYESEIQSLRKKLECICAENQELICSLDVKNNTLSSLKESNERLLKEIEFYKGQIEAYQYCVSRR